MSCSLNICNLVKCVKRNTLSPVQMVFVNRKLMREVEKWETAPEFHDIRSLEVEQLHPYLEAERYRAEALDEKLYKSTAALSIAVTAGGVVAKTVYVGLSPSPEKIITMILLLGSMAMFFLGAMIGFSGIQPKPRYGYGARFLLATALGGDGAKNAMIEAACRFQNMNIVRSNEASAAISLIRWGVIAFTAAILVSFFTPTATRNTPASTISTLAAFPKAHVPVRVISASPLKPNTLSIETR